MFMPLKQQDEFGFDAGTALSESVSASEGAGSRHTQARFEQLRKYKHKKNNDIGNSEKEQKRALNAKALKKRRNYPL